MKTGIPQPLKSHLNADGARKVYPRDSVRIFKSDRMERFTHVHPVVPLLIWVPIISTLMVRAFSVHGNSLLGFFSVGAGALFFWTFFEYFLHRFVFHFPAKSLLGSRIVYIMHGLHHEDPSDPTRLVMPPLPALIYALILIPIFRVIVGAAYAETFIAWFLVGYLIYDYTHYAVHHFTPRTEVGRFLKKHHLLHHFGAYDSKWGVSNPFWDHVFGTIEAADPKRARSSLARNASQSLAQESKAAASGSSQSA